MFLYNDMTAKKERFEPLEPGKVSFYACGPTVYDFFHIGNARPFIIFDALRRYFESRGLTVSFVQNFTDIDDKMITRAAQLGISVQELADKYIAAYYEDADKLGIHRATINPCATKEIPAIIDLISELIKKGHAYPSDDGVYFEVDTFKEYGKLSKQNLEDLNAGARVEVGEHKRNPLDFAIWKFQKPGEPAWDSPWGAGRPGWHIECSAMASRHLGTTIDIHGGGSDLIFPHHENEIAQSEAAHDREFARYWIHNGYVMVDREKMSKSLGNFFTVHDVLQKYPSAVIRLFMLSAHYRSPINFSNETLDQAKHAHERLVNGVSELTFALRSRPCSDEMPCEEDLDLRRAIEEASKLYDCCMQDDFNTAGALGAIFDAIYATNVSLRRTKSTDYKGLEEALAFLKDADSVMGILGLCDDDDTTVDAAKIEALIAERTEARKTKNFARSDEIREELSAMGIVLEDTSSGTRWKKKI